MSFPHDALFAAILVYVTHKDVLLNLIGRPSDLPELFGENDTWKCKLCLQTPCIAKVSSPCDLFRMSHMGL